MMFRIVILAFRVERSSINTVHHVDGRQRPAVIQQAHHHGQVNFFTGFLLGGVHVELRRNDIHAALVVDVLPEIDPLIITKGQITGAKDSGEHPRFCIVNERLVQEKFLLALGSVPKQGQRGVIHVA